MKCKTIIIITMVIILVSLSANAGFWDWLFSESISYKESMGIKQTGKTWKLTRTDGLQLEYFDVTKTELSNTKIKICLNPKEKLKLSDPIIQVNKAYLKKEGIIFGEIEPNDMEIELEKGNVKKFCFDVDGINHNEVQIGTNSIIFIYQEDSLIEYKNGNIETNILLEKFNGVEYVTAPSEVFIRYTDKFGAIDLFATKDTKYRYTFTSPLQWKEISGDYYVEYEGQNRMKVNDADICEERYENKNYSIYQEELGYNLTHEIPTIVFQPNCTYTLLDENTLQLDFIAEYDNNNGFIEIDPFTDATCDSGTLDTVCYLNSTYTYTNGEVISGNGSLYLQDAGDIRNTGNTQYVTINFSNGDITLDDGIILGNPTIYTKNLRIINNGYISGNGYGYDHSAGPGAGGEGASYDAGGGGGHAGNGGWGMLTSHGYGSGAGGAMYDSSNYPFLPGSGGGDGDYVHGGHGGGAIVIYTTESVLLEDRGTGPTIVTNGIAGAGGPCRASGGGAAGSIFIDTYNLSGNGWLKANGGNGGKDWTCNTRAGGGASGGIISVMYNITDNVNLSNFQAERGVPTRTGGGYGYYGMVIWVDKDDNNVGIDYYYRFKDMSGIANESKNTSFWKTNDIHTYTFNNFSQPWGSVLTEQLHYVEVHANNMDILSGNWNFNSMGYAEDTGLGSSYGCPHANYAGGAGYGGAGGTGYCGWGGSVRGSSTNPQEMGSGGGTYTSSPGSHKGGDGGGYLMLNVSGTLNLTGSLYARGGAGQGRLYRSAGGGAGGSIYIIATNLTGTGNFYATGGNAWRGGTPAYGGGGGGGRVAVWVCDNSSYDKTGTYYDVAGGLSSLSGGGNGGVGSFYWGNISCPVSTTLYCDDYEEDSGDWIIDSVVECIDEEFTVTGDIIVDSTGQLYMQNSNITVNDFLFIEGTGDKVFINGNILAGGNN